LKGATEAPLDEGDVVHEFGPRREEHQHGRVSRLERLLGWIGVLAPLAIRHRADRSGPTSVVALDRDPARRDGLLDCARGAITPASSITVPRAAPTSANAATIVSTLSGP
jgi:hypothetical protein